MGHVEFEGKDLEEAIAKAAAALNMPPEKVKFSVTSMGTKGFLGLGRRKARIAVDPDDPALAIDDEPSGGQRGQENKAGPKSALSKGAGERKNRERKKPSLTPGKKRETELNPESGRQPDSKKSEMAGQSQNVSKERHPEKKEKAKERPAAATEALPLDWSHLPPALTKPGKGETLVEGTVDQAGELALDTTKEILARMGFEATISAARINSRIVLSLESADNALLIGARGATLEALQLLVNKIAARRLSETVLALETDCRVVLDVADYRSRRREHLLENLKNLGEQVRQTRKPQHMPGLNSDERRMIQLALRPFKDLHVLPSGGREPLTISPFPPRPRRRATGGHS